MTQKKITACGHCCVLGNQVTASLIARADLHFTDSLSALGSSFKRFKEFES